MQIIELYLSPWLLIVRIEGRIRDFAKILRHTFCKLPTGFTDIGTIQNFFSSMIVIPKFGLREYVPVTIPYLSISPKNSSLFKLKING